MTYIYVKIVSIGCGSSGIQLSGHKSERRRLNSGAARQLFSSVDIQERVAERAVPKTSPPLPSLRLVDIPEDRRRRPAEHAGERFPPGAGREILPERDIDH